MGSFPSLAECSNVNEKWIGAFMKAHACNPKRFHENYNRLGGGLAPSSSKNNVIQIRTVLNYIQMMSSTDVIHNLHNEVEEMKGLCPKKYKEILEAIPNIAKTYMVTKKNPQ